MVDQANEYRTVMIEAVAEADEELMMKYLEGEELTDEEIKAAIRKATIAVTDDSCNMWIIIQEQRCSADA